MVENLRKYDQFLYCGFRIGDFGFTYFGLRIYDFGLAVISDCGFTISDFSF
jgi:hypothetical protein